VSVSALLLLVVAAIIGWWLFARQLTAKPWEQKQSEADDQYGGGASLALGPARAGLWLFLGVITAFFGLFISAYRMRMMVPDWSPLAEPNLLWLNTGMLILSSVAFQLTRSAAERGDAGRVKAGLGAAGLFAVAFLAGQLLAWQQLNASGQYLTSNPAIAFFYLLTGLHGLHLLGGLSVWGRTTAKMWRGGSPLGDIRLSVELCTVYWHYLLLVWLALFGLLLIT
jgi:cytochrome c oxidase subunit 3